MMDRAAAIEAFLARSGWQGVRRDPLVGDASLRRYERLNGGPRPALLMDAPPASGEDVAPFLRVADILRARGLSVPEIFAVDVDAGLLILEDFGTALYAKVAQTAPGQEVTLYRAAGETLASMHRSPPPEDMPRYLPLMANLAALSLDWYAPEHRGHRPDLVAAMATALNDPALAQPTLVHRDFHADNLIWLPDRAGAARVGLLDFQDAMLGPPDYDLASLIDDPRRTVTDAARQAATDAYIAASGRPQAEVATGLAICSTQRCLRILGVFARLCLRDGKVHYPSFIPRTWDALLRNLAHPALADLRVVILNTMPAPTEIRLDAIRSQAGAFRGQDHA
ncbi:MAG: phosphotransferase [Jannaschia sp.]